MADDLWLSFDNCLKAYGEIDSLVEAINRLLAAGLPAAITMDASSMDDDTIDYTKWKIEPYYLWSHKLRAKKQGKKRLGSVSFAASFWRQEDNLEPAWHAAKAAKLYVGYASPDEDWGVEDLFIDGQGNSPSAKLRSDYVWEWPDGIPPVTAWFFCVRLLDLQTRSDLEREVIVPLVKLYLGDADAESFMGTRSTLSPRLAV